MRKRILYVTTFAFAHVVVTACLTIAAFGAVMKGFDGGPGATPRSIALLTAAVDIVTWPLVMATRPTMSSASQYAVLYANGLLWAVAALCVWLPIRRVWPRLAPRVVRNL